MMIGDMMGMVQWQQKIVYIRVQNQPTRH